MMHGHTYIKFFIVVPVHCVAAAF